MTAASMALLVSAVAAVEGNPDGGFADGGRSVGPLCITEPCVRDVNRRFGTAYRWPDDLRDYAVSARVFEFYTARAGEDIGLRTRIWNKGNAGRNKRSAWTYQRKVMTALVRKLDR